VLFLAPCFCLFVIAGTAWIRRRRLATAAAGFLAFLVVVPSVTALPYSRGDVRPILDHVTAHSGDGDVVYLYYGLRLTADWYRRPIAGRLVHGVCAQNQREQYVEELERLRGTRRLWLVLGYDFFLEHAVFFEYMGANATLLESSDSLYLAEARLYDFSGERRAPLPDTLRAARPGPDPGTDCRGIFGRPRTDQASRSQRSSSTTDGRLPVERMPIR
jgi:hypothetical protein